MSQKWEEYTYVDDPKIRFIKMPKGIRLWYSKKVKYAYVDYDLYPTKYQLTEDGRKLVWELYYQVANKKSHCFMSPLTAHMHIPLEHLEHAIMKLIEILPANLEEDPELKKCPNCGTEMKKCIGAYKSGYFTEKEFFEYYRCPKCNVDTRTKDEVY